MFSVKDAFFAAVIMQKSFLKVTNNRIALKTIMMKASSLYYNTFCAVNRWLNPNFELDILDPR